MVAHRDSIHPEPQSILSESVTAKLDRLAELAAESPKVAAVIREQLEALTILEIGGLNPDELEKLSELTAARKAKPK